MLMLRFSPLEQILSDLHANLYRINEIVQVDRIYSLFIY